MHSFLGSFLGEDTVVSRATMLPGLGISFSDTLTQAAVNPGKKVSTYKGMDIYTFHAGGSRSTGVRVGYNARDPKTGKVVATAGILGNGTVEDLKKQIDIYIQRQNQPAPPPGVTSNVKNNIAPTGGWGEWLKNLPQTQTQQVTNETPWKLYKGSFYTRIPRTTSGAPRTQVGAKQPNGSITPLETFKTFGEAVQYIDGQLALMKTRVKTAVPPPASAPPAAQQPQPATQSKPEGIPKELMIGGGALAALLLLAN